MSTEVPCREMRDGDGWRQAQYGPSDGTWDYSLQLGLTL